MPHKVPRPMHTLYGKWCKDANQAAVARGGIPPAGCSDGLTRLHPLYRIRHFGGNNTEIWVQGCPFLSTVLIMRRGSASRRGLHRIAINRKQALYCTAGSVKDGQLLWSTKGARCCRNGWWFHSFGRYISAGNESGLVHFQSWFSEVDFSSVGARATDSVQSEHAPSATQQIS